MTLRPVKLSVGNAPLLEEWQQKLIAFIEKHGRDRIVASVHKMYLEDPEFAGLVQRTIEAGGTFESDDVTEWAKVNLDAAMKLRQSINALPQTIAALRFGVECIKATCDRSLLSPEEVEAFDSVELWDSVDISDVQKYCDALLEMR